MADRISQQAKKHFIEALDSTEQWLADEFTAPSTTTPSDKLAKRLQSYVEHCRRRIRRGGITAAEVARSRHKIEEACYVLMKSRMR